MKAIQIIGLVAFLFITSCAKPYVGRKLKYYHPAVWCKISWFPYSKKQCIIY